ncbi:ABC transporter [Streptomyces sp. yr375]|nr:ABC transporter [Streptomyces sp. yr375]
MSQHRAGLAIETAGLVKTFGRTRAVDGVDLAVPTGTVYGVLGPNGAGKTTTVKTHLASAVRGLMAGDWPGAEIAWSRGWAALFVLVFGPVTMRLYNRK